MLALKNSLTHRNLQVKTIKLECASLKGEPHNLAPVLIQEDDLPLEKVKISIVTRNILARINDHWVLNAQLEPRLPMIALHFLPRRKRQLNRGNGKVVVVALHHPVQRVGTLAQFVLLVVVVLACLAHYLNFVR